jgi:arylformamidase
VIRVKIHDITRALFREDLVYPGDVSPSFVQENRGMYLISDLHLGSHSGTHIDAPSHYLKSGQTVDAVPLESLIGRCQVLDLRDAGSEITAGCLQKTGKGTERLLLKTAYSGKSGFDYDYPHLTHGAAKFLTRQRMVCIGIDSPSIESYQCDGSVHRELLRQGCIIIELLNLAEVNEGTYLLAALPLRLYGVDGSPARVVLIEEEE